MPSISSLFFLGLPHINQPFKTTNSLPSNTCNSHNSTIQSNSSQSQIHNLNNSNHSFIINISTSHFSSHHIPLSHHSQQQTQFNQIVNKSFNLKQFIKFTFNSSLFNNHSQNNHNINFIPKSTHLNNNIYFNQFQST